MHNCFRWSARIAAVMSLVVVAAPGWSQQPTASFEPGQLIVGYKSAEQLDKAVADFQRVERLGGVRARGSGSSSIGVERLSDTEAKLTFDFRTTRGLRLSHTSELQTLQEFATELMQQPDVAYAHPNWIMKLQRGRIADPVHLEDMPAVPRVRASSTVPAEPNDPVFRSGLHWHYLEPPMGMNAVGAWPIARGGKSVVVAVIDTGLLPNHPDIKGSGNILPGYDFISDPTRKGVSTKGPSPDSTDLGDECPAEGIAAASWHGTHVAGTVGAAITNNNVGIAGVNWAVSVLPVRVLGHCGGTIGDVAAAIRWSAGLTVQGVAANAHKADIINLSLAVSNACRPELVGALIDALKAARNAGVVVVAAAGNDAVDIKTVSPSGCAGVIAVASSDQRGHLAPYSNYGAVSIMAPGGDLQRDDDGDQRPDGVWSLVKPTDKYPSGIAAYEGTSMAAPHVSAAIALALSTKPQLRGKPEQIEKLLVGSAATLPKEACAHDCGPGLLDAKRMVQPEVVTSTK